MADSESGVDSKSGVVMYRSAALALVFGRAGACGKIRRFKGLPGMMTRDEASGKKQVIEKTNVSWLMAFVPYIT